LVNACGGFWEEIRFAEDFEFVLRLADRSGRIFYRDVPVAAYTVAAHQGAYSAVTGVERALLAIAVMHRLQILGSHNEVFHCARRVESWMFLKLATYARERGENRKYWAFLFHSISMRVSATAIRMAFGQKVRL
jgi:hypothetical protein